METTASTVSPQHSKCVQERLGSVDNSQQHKGTHLFLTFTFSFLKKFYLVKISLNSFSDFSKRCTFSDTRYYPSYVCMSQFATKVHNCENGKDKRILT